MQRCNQELRYRQEMRSSLHALEHSIGAAPVPAAMALVQDMLRGGCEGR